jgi:hypothetical protein
MRQDGNAVNNVRPVDGNIVGSPESKVRSLKSKHDKQQTLDSELWTADSGLWTHNIFRLYLRWVH